MKTEKLQSWNEIEQLWWNYKVEMKLNKYDETAKCHIVFYVRLQRKRWNVWNFTKLRNVISAMRNCASCLTFALVWRNTFLGLFQEYIHWTLELNYIYIPIMILYTSNIYMITYSVCTPGRSVYGIRTNLLKLENSPHWFE